MSQTPTAAGSNLVEYTVTELSTALKRTVEQNYGRIRVRGELSRVFRAASGHFYMSLKEEDVVLDAVCFRGVAAKLSITPEDGVEVICTGKISTYAPRSSYQIVIESLEIAGEGALLKMLEDRRRMLAEEGLFDEDRKRDLPMLPEVIGLVTSASGAVLHDILHRLADRFPRHVLLWPVLVQGEGAAEQIAAGIRGLNALEEGGALPHPDVVIVARGGGSLEDLWAFNEEIVVRAAAESEIPLISAVGHETDWTLIDHASDLRAPTPTAAAEFAVPVRSELMRRTEENGMRMAAGLRRMVTERRAEVSGLARGLSDPAGMLRLGAQRTDELAGRLNLSVGRFAENKRRRHGELAHRLRTPDGVVRTAGERLTRESQGLARVARRQIIENRYSRMKAVSVLLESVSFQRVLERGYTVIRCPDGTPLSSAAAARAVGSGAEAKIEFADGQIPAVLDPKPSTKSK